MGLQYKKLLPSILRDTTWGMLITAYQSLIADIKVARVKPIYDQVNVDTASNEELINITESLGWSVLTLTGYTSTRDYLVKQVETIVPRIVNKTTKNSYRYTGIIYNIYVEVFPILVTSTGSLIGQLQTAYDESKLMEYATEFLDPEGDNLILFIDSKENNLDADGFAMEESENLGLDGSLNVYGVPRSTGLPPTYLDTTTFASLDPITGEQTQGDMSGKNSKVTNVTRNILFSYSFNYVENINEFLSLNTLAALNNDIFQIRKATETIYFEPVLEITLNLDKSVYTKTYNTFDLTATSDMKGVLIGDDIGKTVKVSFGIGKYNLPFVGPITDVQLPIFSILKDKFLPFADFLPTEINFDFVINERNQFPAFTEVALIDEFNNVIAYANFPKVQWAPTMYNNARLKINVV